MLGSDIGGALLDLCALLPIGLLLWVVVSGRPHVGSYPSAGAKCAYGVVVVGLLAAAAIGCFALARWEFPGGEDATKALANLAWSAVIVVGVCRPVGRRFARRRAALLAVLLVGLFLQALA